MLTPRLFFSNLDPLDFEELEGKVSFKKIKEEVTVTDNGISTLKILLEMQNHTTKNLEDPTFEVAIKNTLGRIIYLSNERIYSLKLPAKKTKNVLLKVRGAHLPEGARTELQLTEMKED